MGVPGSGAVGCPLQCTCCSDGAVQLHVPWTPGAFMCQESALFSAAALSFLRCNPQASAVDLLSPSCFAVTDQELFIMT